MRTLRLRASQLVSQTQDSNPEPRPYPHQFWLFKYHSSWKKRKKKILAPAARTMTASSTSHRAAALTHTALFYTLSTYVLNFYNKPRQALSIIPTCYREKSPANKQEVRFKLRCSGSKRISQPLSYYPDQKLEKNSLTQVFIIICICVYCLIHSPAQDLCGFLSLAHSLTSRPLLLYQLPQLHLPPSFPPTTQPTHFLFCSFLSTPTLTRHYRNPENIK